MTHVGFKMVDATTGFEQVLCLNCADGAAWNCDIPIILTTQSSYCARCTKSLPHVSALSELMTQ